MAVKTSGEDQKRLDVYLHGQARYAMDLKEFPKALTALEKLRVAHPQDPKILVDMSKAMAGADKGRSTRAVQTVKKAQAMAPNAAEVALAVAEIYKAGSQMDEAAASLAMAAKTSDNAALAKESRVGSEKLVVILFGDGTDSLKTWRDPERDAIPGLWNDLRPLGELREAISLEGRFLPQDIAVGITTGRWRPAAEGPATYYQQVRPVLVHYCGKCHQKGEAKGDFVVDDFKKMLQGGEAYEEEVIVSGKGKESHLVRSIVESEMPPKEPLQDKQRLIDLLTKWIDEGAKPGEPVESWQLQAPTFLERFRAARQSPPEKVWAVVGDQVLDPLQASTTDAFGAKVGPTFVCVPRLEQSVAKMQAVLADAAKRNLERPQVMELINKLTPQDLAVPLKNAAAAQLVTDLLKRERFLDKADDRLVHAIARDVIAKHKPEVLLVAFSDPRDGSSAEAIRRVDASVHALWKQLEAIPEYRNNTNFVVVTSFSHENSANVLSIGPRIVAGTVDHGQRRVWDRPAVLTDMMVSLANLLAIDYEIPEGNLKPN